MNKNLIEMFKMEYNNLKRRNKKLAELLADPKFFNLAALLGQIEYSCIEEDPQVDKIDEMLHHNPHSAIYGCAMRVGDWESSKLYDEYSKLCGEYHSPIVIRDRWSDNYFAYSLRYDDSICIAPSGERINVSETCPDGDKQYIVVNDLYLYLENGDINSILESATLETIVGVTGLPYSMITADQVTIQLGDLSRIGYGINHCEYTSISDYERGKIRITRHSNLCGLTIRTWDEFQEIMKGTNYQMNLDGSVIIPYSKAAKDLIRRLNKKVFKLVFGTDLKVVPQSSGESHDLDGVAFNLMQANYSNTQSELEYMVRIVGAKLCAKALGVKVLEEYPDNHIIVKKKHADKFDIWLFTIFYNDDKKVATVWVDDVYVK